MKKIDMDISLYLGIHLQIYKTFFFISFTSCFFYIFIQSYNNKKQYTKVYFLSKNNKTRKGKISIVHINKKFRNLMNNTKGIKLSVTLVINSVAY